MTASWQSALEDVAVQAGWNLTGLVDTERFDRSQPPERRCSRLLAGCGTALVFGSGGHAAWRRGTVTCGPGGASQRVLPGLRAVLREAGLHGRVIPAACGGRLLNFPRLAEEAGLGSVSPVLGVLLHPRFGPWVGVRAAVLLPGRPFGPIADHALPSTFQPCAACSRPCLEACPVTVDPTDPACLERPSTSECCVEHYRAGGCTVGCAARAACPVGASERCDERSEAVLHEESMRANILRLRRGPWDALRRLLGR